MCDECRRRENESRAMWLTVRRALLMIAAAIAKRYDAQDQQRAM